VDYTRGKDMKLYKDLYCKIFIDTEIVKEELIELLHKRIRGEISKSNITSNSLDIHVSKNHDFDKIQKNDKLNGFLYSQYYLDIEPMNSIDQEIYINNIAELLNYLWKMNMKSVAACDFEEELSNIGLGN
jgi:hypothetical protein